MGFNDKRNDLETETQDYGMRIYNPSLGRFLSVDPLTAKYPWYSPYQFAGNNPIWANDVDGLEENVKSTNPDQPQVPQLQKLDFKQIKARADRIEIHVNNIINAVLIDDKLKQKQEVRAILIFKINKFVEFDNDGNPSKVYGQEIFGGQSGVYNKMLQKGLEIAKDEALDKAKETAIEFGLKKVGIKLTQGVLETIFAILDPTPMGTGDSPQSMQFEMSKKSAERKSEELNEAYNSKVSGAVDEVFLGKRQTRRNEPLKLEVKKAVQDKVKITIRL